VVAWANFSFGLAAGTLADALDASKAMICSSPYGSAPAGGAMSVNIIAAIEATMLGVMPATALLVISIPLKQIGEVTRRMPAQPPTCGFHYSKPGFPSLWFERTALCIHGQDIARHPREV
jgi:hypothetical protein